MANRKEASVQLKTPFMLVNCPNCKDDRYEKLSRGGWSNPGKYAAVMPSCLVCSGVGKLAVCYNCNAVRNYYFDSIKKKCMECNFELVECMNHSWSHMTENGKFHCEACGKNGTPIADEAPSCSQHIWHSDSEGNIACQVCRKRGLIR